MDVPPAFPICTKSLVCLVCSIVSGLGYFCIDDADDDDGIVPFASCAFRAVADEIKSALKLANEEEEEDVDDIGNNQFSDHLV